MKIKNFTFIFFLAGFLTLPSYGSNVTYKAEESIKDVAYFPIGNVVSSGKLKSNSIFVSMLKRDFNSITAENQMKMANMFKAPGVYDFKDGDEIVKFAKENNFRVFGHALIWHSSIPKWLKNYKGTNEDFESLIKKYIQDTVSHFAKEKITIEGKKVSIVEGWDVVNEAFTTGAENSIFRKKMGENYVEKCFKWAREADPEVKLFYNDYNLESYPEKIQKVQKMIKNFQDKNIPIDGIGFQMHIDHLNPKREIIENNLKKIIDSGLLIHFSEIDITVNREKLFQKLNYEKALIQEEKYKEIAEIYMSVPKNQQFGITFWGMRDNDSWLLNFHNNKYEYPSLYTSNYEFKISHRGFIKGLKGN